MTKTRQTLSAEELENVAWRVSQYSSSGGDGSSCVEVGPLGDGTGRVAVRHSHHPDGAVIVCTGQEWDAFRHGMTAGEFDF